MAADATCASANIEARNNVARIKAPGVMISNSLFGACHRSQIIVEAVHGQWSSVITDVSVRTNDVAGVEFRRVSGRKVARAVFQDGGADHVPRLRVRGSDQNQPESGASDSLNFPA